MCKQWHAIQLNSVQFNYSYIANLQQQLPQGSSYYKVKNPSNHMTPYQWACGDSGKEELLFFTPFL